MLADSMHQTVQALGITKSKKKANKVIEKSSRKLASLIAAQMKKELKKIRSAKIRKSKKTKEQELEIA